MRLKQPLTHPDYGDRVARTGKQRNLIAAVHFMVRSGFEGLQWRPQSPALQDLLPTIDFKYIPRTDKISAKTISSKKSLPSMRGG